VLRRFSVNLTQYLFNVFVMLSLLLWCTFLLGKVAVRGVQDPEYRSRLRKESTFFSRTRSRTRSGNFWLEQD